MLVAVKIVDVDGNIYTGGISLLPLVGQTIRYQCDGSLGREPADIMLQVVRVDQQPGGFDVVVEKTNKPSTGAIWQAT